MASVQITPAARADLAEIFEYTRAKWGAAQAERYLREIDAAMKRAAAKPRLDRRREDLPGAPLCAPAGRHLLFYVVEGRQARVLRVLHPA